jgi:putative tryptophan/tyrosine transport system substrate-binding protein
MRRRDFIGGLVFAAVTGRAQAQQTGKVYRIAIGHPTVPLGDLNQACKGSLVIPAIFEELLRLRLCRRAQSPDRAIFRRRSCRALS